MTSAYHVPFRSPEQNNVEALKAEFFRLSTSDTLSTIFNKRLGVKIAGWWQPSGGCCHVHENHVVPCGKSENNFCLSRAMVYGRAVLTMESEAFHRFVALDLERETINLMQVAGLSMGKKTYHLEDAQALLNALGDKFRLVIYDEFKNVVLNTALADYTIVLSLKNKHFDFIPQLNVFLRVGFLPLFTVILN